MEWQHTQGETTREGEESIERESDGRDRGTGKENERDKKGRERG